MQRLDFPRRRPINRSDDILSPGEVRRPGDDYVLGNKNIVNRLHYLQSLVEGGSLEVQYD